MPELPEVETVVKTLRPGVLGRTIVNVTQGVHDVVTPSGFDLGQALVGRTIAELARRAKRIVFTIDDGSRFYIHLGMTGRLTLQKPADQVLPHTHLTLEMDDGHQVRFRDPRRFGGVWWLGSESAEQNLGPEPLATRPQQLARRLGGTRRAIKNVLLDQRVIAGLGNIYVDESLFRARIHPLAVANLLSPEQVAALSRAIKQTLRKAIRHRGSTLRDYFDANNNPGGFKALHAVYDRFDEPCRTCRTPVQRIVLGGRSTHFCPKCQRL